MKNEKIEIDFNNYYINQNEEEFKGITFGKDKNQTTVGSDGCGICCCAMIICKECNVTDKKTQAEIIKKIIKDAINDNGFLVWGKTVKYSDKEFKFIDVSDMAEQIKTNGLPSLCHLQNEKGEQHFVLVNGYDSSLPKYTGHFIKDPGQKGYTTLQEAMNLGNKTILKRKGFILKNNKEKEVKKDKQVIGKWKAEEIVVGDETQTDMEMYLEIKKDGNYILSLRETEANSEDVASGNWALIDGRLMLDNCMKSESFARIFSDPSLREKLSEIFVVAIEGAVLVLTTSLVSGVLVKLGLKKVK